MLVALFVKLSLSVSRITHNLQPITLWEGSQRMRPPGLPSFGVKDINP